MPVKFVAILLLIFGVGVTLYVIYRAALALLHPVVQKKLEEQMQKERAQQLQNNLQLHQQPEQDQVSSTTQDAKK